MTFNDSPWGVLDLMPAMTVSQSRHLIYPNVRYFGLKLVKEIVWHYTLCYTRGEERSGEGNGERREEEEGDGE